MARNLDPERIRRLLNNPLTRMFLRHLSRRRKSGKLLVEEIVGSFGKGFKFRYFLYHLLLELVLKAYQIDRQKAIDEFFSVPTYQKAVALLTCSVARYGATTPQQFAFPILVVWNFTNACNLRCRHCYQDAGRSLEDELSLEEQLQVVEQLDYHHVPAVALSGGEPLVSRNFWRVAEEIHKRGIYLSVATNGTLLSPENVTRLKEVGVDYVEVSLDSADPDFHDSFRGVPGMWERTVKGIENCLQQSGLKVGIAATITRQNYRQVPELISFAKKLGVHIFYVFNFIPTGRGAGMAEQDLTPKMREELLGILYEELKKEEIGVMSTMPQYGRFCLQHSREEIVITSHYTLEKGKIARQIAEYVGGCGAGRCYVALQPNGEVTPCVFMPIPLGSLREQSLLEIWQNSPVLQELRDRSRFQDSCGSCDFQSVCGGCRARAYGYFGDYMAPDPGCVNNAHLWAKIASAEE